MICHGGVVALAEQVVPNIFISHTGCANATGISDACKTDLPCLVFSQRSILNTLMGICEASETVALRPCLSMSLRSIPPPNPTTEMQRPVTHVCVTSGHVHW